jgi:hypothetical protein
LTDDLNDSTPADETISFGVDSVSYEIDLSQSNAAELRGLLRKYVGAARRVSRGGVPAPRRGGGTKSDPAQLAAIRDWAEENGHTVSARGRIPKSVVEAYEAAH